MVETIATGGPGCTKPLPGCLFVTVPDRVGSAEATLELFERWQPPSSGWRLPLALVLQNGQERHRSTSTGRPSRRGRG